jgi:ATP-binding cassette subfamily C protein CydD
VTTPLNSPFTEHDAPKEARKKAERFLRERLNRDGRRHVHMAALMGLLGTLCLVVQTFAFATVIHASVIEDVGFSGATPWLFVFGAAIASRAVFAYFSERFGIEGALAVQQGLRREVLDRLFSGGATGGFPAAHTATALVEQTDKLEGYYARYQPLMLLAVLSPLAILAFVFPANALVGLVLLLSAPLIPLYMALVGMDAEDESRKQFESLRKLSGYFLDRLQGLATLKRLGYAAREPQNIAAASDELRSRTMRVLRVAFLSSTVLEFFSTFAVAICATYVGLALLGWMSLGVGPEGMTLRTGFFLLLLAPAFFQPLRAFAAAYHDRADAIAAAEDLAPLVAKPENEAEEEPAGGLTLRSIERIELRGATLRYANRKNAALFRVELRLSTGRKVAVVGPSGSGKSTLLGVVSGQIPPTEGEFLVNGRRLDEYKPGALSALTSWIGQRPYLFPATLAENIALGQPGKTREEIEEAARKARVAEFAARLPDGLDTAIGERGHGLSGGEAQRVALARAFLKDVPLLILDEPTAHLDPGNEAAIVETIAKLSEGKTVLLAAHGRALLRLCDSVVRLEDGVLDKDADRAA